MKKIFLIFTALILISAIQCEKRIPPRKLACWPDVLNHENFAIDFYLSSKVKKNQLYRSNADLEKVDFDPKQRTVLVVHGLGGNGNDVLIRNLRDALLAWHNVNVIVVNWDRGAANPLFYHLAAVNTEYVAWRIREFLNKIFQYWKNEKNVPKERWGPLHFVGLSLGAHVVGQSAGLLQREDNILVNRVTGLDPAEPCFEDEGMPLRLNKTNARFVDVIHTDASKQKNGAFGLLQPLGHADFYVNGGMNQPGCRINLRRKRYIDYSSLLLHALNNGGCDHVRAMVLFTESIKQETEKRCKFWAYALYSNTSQAEAQQIINSPCDASSCWEMGINAENYSYEKAKIFYVSTMGYSPFCNTYHYTVV